jgi:hypothetical protein
MTPYISNIGSLDKSIRVVLSITSVAIHSIDIIESLANVIFLILAGLFIVTAFIRYCPFYSLFNFSTAEDANYE